MEVKLDDIEISNWEEYIAEKFHDDTFYEIEDLLDENGNAAGTKVNLKISYKESLEEIV